jgi:antitoxin ParD1/3/4
MNVTLPGEFADFVSQKVASGRYSTVTEVIQEALRLLREQDERQSKLEELRQEIAVGIAEADQGKVAPLRASETLSRIRQRRSGGDGEAK